MLDILVREALTMWTLRQANSFTQRAVIGFTVLSVQRDDRISTFDTDGHGLIERGLLEVRWRKPL